MNKLLVITNCVYIMLHIVFVQNIKAQNFAQPFEPINNDTILTQTPTLKWLAADDAIFYNVNIFECNYDTATQFTSLKLNEYTLSEEYIYNTPTEASGLAIKNDKLIIVNNDNKYFNEQELIILDQNFGNESTVDINLSNAEDFEGITHIGQDYYMIGVEETGEIIFTEVNNGNLNLITNYFFGVGAGDFGFEGIAINPISNSGFIITEKFPKRLFTFNLPTAPLFNDVITLNEPFSLETKLAPLAISDVSGIYHLSSDLFLTGTNTAKNFLVLSDESKKIVEMDIDGNIISSMDIGNNGANNTLTNQVFQPEGIAYVNGKVFVVSESLGNVITKFYRFENPNYQQPTAINTNPVLQINGIANTQFQIPANTLTPNIKYCWEVEAVFANGTTAEKQVQCFTIENVITNNCLTSSFTIDAISTNNVTCNNTDNGNVSLMVNGNSGNFSYFYTLNNQLINAGNLTDGGVYNINNLSAGEWKFYLTDANNCQTNTTVFIYDCIPLCVSILNLTNNINAETYIADDVIECSTNVDGEVTFLAGAKNDNTEYIELQQGFSCDGNHTFEAINIDCDDTDN